MKYCVSILACLLILSRCGSVETEKENESLPMKSAEETFDDFLANHELTRGKYTVYFRVFKQEQLFEVWTQKENETFKLASTYSFCANSGTLGPKLKQGDLQIPEGIYRIDRFNPKSRFHLSMGINYPNAVDLVHADQKKPGGDIFIHGGCASVGCISITNKSIDLVYRLAENSTSPYSIQAHFFPFRFDEAHAVEKMDCGNPDTKRLWESLEPIYASFEQNKQVPRVLFKGGKYELKD